MLAISGCYTSSSPIHLRRSTFKLCHECHVWFFDQNSTVDIHRVAVLGIKTSHLSPELFFGGLLGFPPNLHINTQQIPQQDENTHNSSIKNILPFTRSRTSR